MRTPRPTSSVTSSWLNGRLALGISALPGSLAKTVWYCDSGHSRGVWRYRIGRPCTAA